MKIDITDEYEQLIDEIVKELENNSYDSKTDIKGDIFVYLYDEELPYEVMEELGEHITDCVWDLTSR